MSDKNGGADDFMAEMAQFLKPGDFQRPSDGDSKKLKLKKPKKDKKEKKVKISEMISIVLSTRCCRKYSTGPVCLKSYVFQCIFPHKMNQ